MYVKAGNLCSGVVDVSFWISN